MNEELTKSQKRDLARQEKQKQKTQGMKKNTVVKAVVLLVLAFGLYKFFVWFNSPVDTSTLPGQEVADLGRDHTVNISGIIYNSNPPTSGEHFPVWAKKGVYDRLVSDGYLIHSLEHGYVIISYDCTKLSPASGFSLVKSVFAHEGEEIPVEGEDKPSSPLHKMLVGTEGDMSFFTPENPPAVEVALPEDFGTEECKSLVNELSSFVSDWERLIVVPRVNMDTQIALTAWTRIQKLDKLDNQTITDFIKAYHNRGPEVTNE